MLYFKYYYRLLLVLIMSINNFNLFRSTYNKYSIPKKIYSRETEDVYKLNFFNINNNSKSNRKDKKYMSELKLLSVETSELFRSIEKVKKILPNISNLINITENKKTELRYYQRLEHKEYEESFKKELNSINEKKEKIKILLFEKMEKVQNLENQMSDIEYNLKAFVDIKNTLLYKKELKKKNNARFSVKQLSSPKKNILSFQNEIIENSPDKNIKNKSIINAYNPINIISPRNSCGVKIVKTLNNNDNESSDIDLMIEKQKQREKINKMQKMHAQFKFEKNKLNSEIKKLEEEKEILKNKKESIKEHLYLYYLDILKDGNDTRNDGLVWIVKEILKLGKIVLISYFPKYLNEPEILYIFKQAKLKIILEDYEKQIQKLRKELISLNLIKKLNKEDIKINDITIKDFYKFKENHNNYISKIKLKKELSDYSLKCRPLILDQNINQNNLFSKLNNLNDYSKYNSTARTAFSNINIDNNINSTDMSFNANNNDHNDCSLNDYNNNLIDKNNNNNNNIYININNKTSSFPKVNKLSRNKLNYFKHYLLLNSKIFGINSKKLDLSHIDSIPDKLSLTEVKEIFQTNTSKINENNYGKIQKFFQLNKTILYIKKVIKETKRKEIKRIFEEFLKKGYNNNLNTEKETILSALIGEDNVLEEINRQKREIKIYLKSLNNYS